MSSGLGSTTSIARGTPKAHTAEVEHEGLLKVLVRNQESEGGHVHCFMALLYGLDEGSSRHHEIGGSVDNMDINSGIGLRKVERRVRLRLDLVVCHGLTNCTSI